MLLLNARALYREEGTFWEREGMGEGLGGDGWLD
jgi:hypothetical protein